MILLTGGAGYIGSHTNKALHNKGYNTVIVDNLVNGHEEFVKWGAFENYNVGDSNLREVFEKYDIEGVMHFAAYAYVGESYENPEKYFKNNYENTLNLLNLVSEFNVNKFIFSSTCTLYGNTDKIPINEGNPLNPINPYGQSKLLVEKALKEKSQKEPDFNYVSLRYFNAAGCDFDCEIGEKHIPEPHLIPLILDVAIGKRECINVFGNDYNTPDGTCIRDYIHVNDLADAHIKAYEYLCSGNASNIFNLGNNKGYSVLDVVKMCEEVTGKEIPIEIADRRMGDPETLISDSSKIKQELNWIPKYDLKKIIESAWEWHKKMNGLER